MAHVIFRRAASLSGVKKVTVVSPSDGYGKKSRVRVVFRDRKPDRLSSAFGDDDIRVTIVRPETGVVLEGELDESGPRRKKQTKMLRPIERAVRKIARREFGIAQVYLARHQRSNRLKKDGWIKDLGKNIRRAIRDSH